MAWWLWAVLALQIRVSAFALIRAPVCSFTRCLCHLSNRCFYYAKWYIFCKHNVLRTRHPLFFCSRAFCNDPFIQSIIQFFPIQLDEMTMRLCCRCSRYCHFAMHFIYMISLTIAPGSGSILSLSVSLYSFALLKLPWHLRFGQKLVCYLELARSRIYTF